MNFKRHLKQSHNGSILFALVVVAIVLGLGTVIAKQQRDSLVYLVDDVSKESLQIDIKKLLADRNVVVVTDEHPTLDSAFDAFIKSLRFEIPVPITYLDQYLQASRVLNSEFRKNPEAAEKIAAKKLSRTTETVATATNDVSSTDDLNEVTSDSESVPGPPTPRDVVSIPWYVVFFGYEQYVCFLLAALCLGELYTIRRRLRAEELLSTNTTAEIRLNIVGDNEIDTETTQTVIDRFNQVVGKNIYGEKTTYSDSQLQKMQRYAWAAMVNNLFEVFRRTGDRLQSLEAATSAHESAQARFDGSFHFEQYLQWAIPSIGFLGTIRGIAAAMGAAQVADDLPIVVSYLGVAFYSTLTALVLNLLLMGVRAGTLSRADEVFAGLDETLRRDVVPRLATRVVVPTGLTSPNADPV